MAVKNLIEPTYRSCDYYTDYSSISGSVNFGAMASEVVDDYNVDHSTFIHGEMWQDGENGNSASYQSQFIYWIKNNLPKDKKFICYVFSDRGDLRNNGYSNAWVRPYIYGYPKNSITFTFTRMENNTSFISGYCEGTIPYDFPVSASVEGDFRRCIKACKVFLLRSKVGDSSLSNWVRATQEGLEICTTFHPCPMGEVNEDGTVNEYQETTMVPWNDMGYEFELEINDIYKQMADNPTSHHLDQSWYAHGFAGLVYNTHWLLVESGTVHIIEFNKGHPYESNNFTVKVKFFDADTVKVFPAPKGKTGSFLEYLEQLQNDVTYKFMWHYDYEVGVYSDYWTLFTITTTGKTYTVGSNEFEYAYIRYDRHRKVLTFKAYSDEASKTQTFNFVDTFIEDVTFSELPLDGTFIFDGYKNSSHEDLAEGEEPVPVENPPSYKVLIRRQYLLELQEILRGYYGITRLIAPLEMPRLIRGIGMLARSGSFDTSYDFTNNGSFKILEKPSDFRVGIILVDLDILNQIADAIRAKGAGFVKDEIMLPENFASNLRTAIANVVEEVPEDGS